MFDCPAYLFVTHKALSKMYLCGLVWFGWGCLWFNDVLMMTILLCYISLSSGLWNTTTTEMKMIRTKIIWFSDFWLNLYCPDELHNHNCKVEVLWFNHTVILHFTEQLHCFQLSSKGSRFSNKYFSELEEADIVHIGSNEEGEERRQGLYIKWV